MRPNFTANIKFQAKIVQNETVLAFKVLVLIKLVKAFIFISHKGRIRATMSKSTESLVSMLPRLIEPSNNLNWVLRVAKRAFLVVWWLKNVEVDRNHTLFHHKVVTFKLIFHDFDSFNMFSVRLLNLLIFHKIYPFLNFRKSDVFGRSSTVTGFFIGLKIDIFCLMI